MRPWQGSNLRLPPPEGGALSAELHGQGKVSPRRGSGPAHCRTGTRRSSRPASRTPCARTPSSTSWCFSFRWRCLPTCFGWWDRLESNQRHRGFTPVSCRLDHSPLVATGGLAPPTSDSSDRRSNWVSYVTLPGSALRSLGQTGHGPARNWAALTPRTIRSCRCRTNPASRGVTSALNRLQSRQQPTRFFSRSLPPRDLGMMWSTVSAGPVRQYRQEPSPARISP